MKLMNNYLFHYTDNGSYEPISNSVREVKVGGNVVNHDQSQLLQT